ncbi:MAG: sigma-70 family RNA polymerase sigma factor [Ruminococcaceae bacterium]|nr:sigma-70 family RNA polymerase sigma factor [Oscillospiraceae bacterium]
MEDTEIIEMYWARDERAIPVTAEKYGSYCAAIAGNILGSREDAEECVNDTWLQVWKAIPPHRPGGFAAFLGKITRNLAINRYKRGSAEKRGGGEISAVLEELSEMVSGKENTEAELMRKEFAEALNAFLKELPEEKRNIFVCRYWYSDSVTEIAERYGRREGTVSMILSRLRIKLRKYLLERGFEL